jgi:hypothetical protein
MMISFSLLSPLSLLYTTLRVCVLGIFLLLLVGDLAFGMQTQETTAVPDRDYVPLKTLLADNENGLIMPAVHNSKEHPV